MEYGLEGVHYYDPPNLTYPYGSYVVVVEVDAETGVWKVQRMVALDDCGVRINPMIVEGQIHGGLTEGFAMSSMQWITFDEDGNCIGSNFMDYLIPTAWETPRFELLETCVPSPHHPIGAKGVGESATVGSPAAFVNAVIDARRAPRRAQHRHAAAARPGVVGDPGRRRAADVDARRPRRRGRAGERAASRSCWRRWCGGGRRRRASVGSKAIIRADGTVEGWLGGACAEPTVVREAQAAMADGRPRLLFLGRPDELDRRAEAGMVTVPMACESEGAMEVYLEPVLPAPQVVVIGRSPAVYALAALARRARLGRRGDRRRRRRRTSIRIPSSCARRSTCRASASAAASAIVVATQGHYDDLALEAALATDAGYIGLVAAEKRAASTLELLRGRGSATSSCCRVDGAGRARPRARRERRDRASRCSPISSPGGPPGGSPRLPARPAPPTTRSTRCAA